MADMRGPVSNPTLLKLIREYKEGREDQVWDRILGEIALNARFLMPARLPAGLKLDSDIAQMQAGARLEFIMLANTEGQKFFLAFTDEDELRKWQTVENQQTVVVGFDDYADLVLPNADAAGFVINPYNENLTLNRELVRHLKKRKEIFLTNRTEQAVETVGVRIPVPYPDRLAGALRSYMEGDRRVRSACLLQMKREEKEGYLCVVDFQGDRREVFDQIAGAVRPFLEGAYLELVPLDNPFGQQAAALTEPFYKRKT
ncbi:MAG: enhanced serine sensitivity protein SseB [Clostridiales bacterium]|nr:enhanced serine sensitivity protein SseB [Clostridiales bacterium]